MGRTVKTHTQTQQSSLKGKLTCLASAPFNQRGAAARINFAPPKSDEAVASSFMQNQSQNGEGESGTLPPGCHQTSYFKGTRVEFSDIAGM